MNTRDWNYKSVVEVAKIVRKVLKSEFPETKFSVRSSRYSMGASIDIEWTDGPTTKSVNEVTRFQSIDSYDITDLAQETKKEFEGEEFTSGADHISTRRNYSRGLLELAASQGSKLYGLPALEIATWDDGRAYIANDQTELANTRVNEGPTYYYSSAVNWEAAQLTSDDVKVASLDEKRSDAEWDGHFAQEDADNEEDRNDAEWDAHWAQADLDGEEANVNEILEYEKANPVEFEPNEITAAIQDPNKGGK